jgi:enoyl-CoA hydratase/carnithine racemase
MTQAKPVETRAEPLLLRETAGGIARLTLNRPKQYNSLCEELLGALHEAFAQIDRDEGVRVVVLAGAGKAFCAGHDLKEMRARPEQAYYEDLFARCGELMLAINRLRQPVIARVHGIATAAGCQLAATCDLTVASTEAAFGGTGINLGLFCMSPGVAISRKVSRNAAFEMVATGELQSAERALEVGLVNHVVAPEALDATVDRLARVIAAKPPAAIAAGKRLFYRQLEVGLAEAYGMAAKEMACNMTFPETQEGVDAFLEKRKPRWSTS